MFKISWKWVGGVENIGVWCEDRSILCTMIGMLEANPKVEQLKIEIAGHVIQNLRNELGIGDVTKFVTQFTYSEVDY